MESARLDLTHSIVPTPAPDPAVESAPAPAPAPAPAVESVPAPPVTNPKWEKMATTFKKDYASIMQDFKDMADGKDMELVELVKVLPPLMLATLTLIQPVVAYGMTSYGRHVRGNDSVQFLRHAVSDLAGLLCMIQRVYGLHLKTKRETPDYEDVHLSEQLSACSLVGMIPSVGLALQVAEAYVDRTHADMEFFRGFEEVD